MSITHSPIDGLRNQLIEMASHETGLRKQLAEATKAREILTAQLLKELDIQKCDVEQQIFRLQFEAGDETVERDEAAGNGFGGYRRKQADFNVTADRFTISNGGVQIK